jgi:hypothetical protein
MALTPRTICRCLAAIAGIGVIVGLACEWFKFDKLATTRSIRAKVEVVAVAPSPSAGPDARVKEGIPEIEEAKRLWRFSLGVDRTFRIKRGLVTAEDAKLAEQELKLAEELAKRPSVR